MNIKDCTAVIVAISTFLVKMAVRVLRHGGYAGPRSIILGLDGDGKIVHNLQDPAGGYFRVTSVSEFEGVLYLGSIVENALGRIAAP